MKKCSVCHSKNIKHVDDVYVCQSCDYIGGADELTALKKVVREKAKNSLKKKAEAEFQRLQEERTKEPYLRFRVFVVEDKNGPEFARDKDSEDCG